MNDSKNGDLSAYKTLGLTLLQLMSLLALSGIVLTIVFNYIW